MKCGNLVSVGELSFVERNEVGVLCAAQPQTLPRSPDSIRPSCFGEAREAPLHLQLEYRLVIQSRSRTNLRVTFPSVPLLDLWLREANCPVPRFVLAM